MSDINTSPTIEAIIIVPLIEEMTEPRCRGSLTETIANAGVLKPPTTRLDFLMVRESVIAKINWAAAVPCSRPVG